MINLDSGSPEIKELAQALLDCETPTGETAQIDLYTVFRVCQKLRTPLGSFAGIEGFRSLLSRALMLARADFALLAAVRVKTDGTFDFLDEAELLFHGEESATVAYRLVEELVRLLSSLIGQSLTLRILRRTWPSLGIISFDIREPNE